MRKALGLLVALGLATPARADQLPQQAPAPAPVPGEPPPDTKAGSEPAEPPVDPAYGEHPGAQESATRAGPNMGGPVQGRDIVIKYHPDRSHSAIAIVGALGGAAVVFGAVGLYYHLDSQDASDAVAAHRFTAQTWTAERQATYDRSHHSATIATISYGIGGAFLIGTVIAYILTEPPQQELMIHPHTDAVQHSTIVAPIRGGAIVARGWSF